ncbi:MAG: type IV pilin protein [Deltaproteobacteria bacterium]|jgi:prepilin-type N-terminal cleavage/methylation domain-containing protein
MLKGYKKTLASSKGFTLVELLIVVAIIGVLASQGVPAYRRMIQKSRKGEAQVMLGNIGTAESGFFSEYGVYTNNIARAGAQMEGQQFVYAAGFTDGGCVAQANIVPVQGNGVGQVPNLPGNWAQGVPGPIAPAQLLTTAVGKVTNNVAAPRTLCRTVANGAPAFAAPGVANNNSTYVAAATGNIAETTGATVLTCPAADVNNCDAWYIDQNRLMVNVQDGTRN